MDVEQFRKLPLLGIIRGIPEDSVEPLFEAITESGLRTVEITMNTENAAALIRKAARLFSKRLTIGAGTVLTVPSLQAALEAGASFMVMPVVVQEVIAYCVQHKIPVFPGAFGPQEIYNAWCFGATMVKVFPAKMLGPGYFREVKGPFPEIELLACSGVTPDNLKDYFENGASAVAMGASVFNLEWIGARAYDKIKTRIREYITAYAVLDRK